MSIETNLNKEQIESLYNSSGAFSLYKDEVSDIKKVVLCNRIRNYNYLKRYSDSSQVFSNIVSIETPMLCFRFGNLEDEFKRTIWTDSNYIVDEKIDGERCLFFYERNNGIRLFSRENDESTLLPLELSSNIINEVFEEYLNNKKELNNFVLDCEIVRNDSSDIIYVFDCLYYNNNDIKTLSLLERKKIVSEIISIINYPLIKQTVFSTENKFKFYEKIIEHDGEGVIFKNINSQYNIKGTRSKKSWIKVKGSMYDFSIIEDTLEGFISSIKQNDNNDLNKSNVELSCFVDNKKISFPMTYVNINLFLIQLFGNNCTINSYINKYNLLNPLPKLEKNLLGKVVEFKSSYFDSDNKCFKNSIPIKFRNDKAMFDCHYSSEVLKKWSAR